MLQDIVCCHKCGRGLRFITCPIPVQQTLLDILQERYKIFICLVKFGHKSLTVLLQWCGKNWRPTCSLLIDPDRHRWLLSFVVFTTFYFICSSRLIMVCISRFCWYILNHTFPPDVIFLTYI